MGVPATLGRRDIRGMFFHRLEEVSEASWAPRVSHMFQSDQDSEIYRFLGQSPALREWIGSRRPTEPKNFEITVRNAKFEATIPIAVDDMRRETVDQIRPRIRDLGARAAILPQKTLTTLLQANETAYDGVAYFGNHLTGRGNRISNALTDSSVVTPATPTTAEMASGILASIENILGALDDQGEPLNEFATEFTVMVPTAYWGVANGAVNDVFTALALA